MLSDLFSLTKSPTTFIPFNLSGAWYPGKSNYFALGGLHDGKVYIWDARGRGDPVEAYDTKMNHDGILSVRFADNQMLAMSEIGLVFSHYSLILR